MTHYDWRADREQRRRETRAALAWWRQRHPEFADPKSAPIRSHGWYGKAVFPLDARYDGQPIATVTEILQAYRNRETA